MARGRMLNKTISTSVKFNKLSDNNSRLLYCMALPHTDDFGRMAGDSFTIKAVVVPMICEYTIDEIERCLRCITKVELIKRADVDGKIVLEYCDFSENQAGLHKRTSSKFPEIPGNSGIFPPNRTEENLREENLTDNITLPPLLPEPKKKPVLVKKEKVADPRIKILIDHYHEEIKKLDLPNPTDYSKAAKFIERALKTNNPMDFFTDMIEDRITGKKTPDGRQELARVLDLSRIFEPNTIQNYVLWFSNRGRKKSFYDGDK